MSNRTPSQFEHFEEKHSGAESPNCVTFEVRDYSNNERVAIGSNHSNEQVKSTIKPYYSFINLKKFVPKSFIQQRSKTDLKSLLNTKPVVRTGLKMQMKRRNSKSQQRVHSKSPTKEDDLVPKPSYQLKRAVGLAALSTKYKNQQTERQPDKLVDFRKSKSPHRLPT